MILTLELEALARKTKYLIKEFYFIKASLINKEYYDFECLSRRFSKITMKFLSRIEYLKREYIE